MDCEASNAVNNGDVNVVSRSRKRNNGEVSEREKQKCDKVPRKAHKAEREKRKRDNMNVLFSELAEVLEPSHQNYGKACLLRETIRLVGELITRVDSLRKENAALSSESHYMTIEKDELKEEKCALERQIEELRNEIDETFRSQTTNIIDHGQSHNTTSLPEEHLRKNAGDYAAPACPILIVPLQNELQRYNATEKAEAVSNIPSPNVSKPRPRYPSPSDSWPSHLLSGLLSTTTEVNK